MTIHTDNAVKALTHSTSLDDLLAHLVQINDALNDLLEQTIVLRRDLDATRQAMFELKTMLQQWGQQNRS